MLWFCSIKVSKTVFKAHKLYLFSSCFVPEVFVTEFPSDQDMYVGRSQAILCSAKGYPKPTFQWYKDRRKVKLDDSHFTLMDNGSLLINPVHELDKGEYICRITQLGDVDQGTNLREEQKDITVTVYGKIEIELCCETTVLWLLRATFFVPTC